MFESMDHHPNEDLLIDHAAGTLPPAASLLVATHLALCPACRRVDRALDAVGGALLDLAEAAPVRTRCEDVLARIDHDLAPAPVKAGRWDGETINLIPQPLRGYLDRNVGELRWRKVNSALGEVALDVGDKRGRASLMRIKAGGAMPRHSHGGEIGRAHV